MIVGVVGILGLSIQLRCPVILNGRGQPCGRIPCGLGHHSLGIGHLIGFTGRVVGRRGDQTGVCPRRNGAGTRQRRAPVRAVVTPTNLSTKGIGPERLIAHPGARFRGRPVQFPRTRGIVEALASGD